ncbi:MAG: hypothetical protein JO347_08700 [Candidatus Eremiobacteraeota bacterium]|nr:hypothetical protein [Candidatus Eremiobacteraeota bacterium]
MRTRIIFALVAAVTLAGCAGSGAGGPFPNPPGGGSTPTSLTSQEAAQAGADSAMAEIERGSLDSSLFSGSVGVVLSSARVPMSVNPATGTCHNGVIKTVTVISPTETQYDVQVFYDLACTQLRRDTFSDVQMPNPSTENITRTIKNYNNSGLLLSTRDASFSVTGSPGNFSAVVTSSLFVGTETTPEQQSGHQLTVAPQNATTWTIAGNGAAIDNVGVPSINESFGDAVILQNTTATTDASSDVTFAGTRNKTVYKGALGSLSLPASPPFTVSGGSQVGSGSLTGSIEFDSSDNLLNVSINGTLVNGNLITVTSSGSGATIAINGTISSPGGTQLATFSVDRFGDGIITYANGTQALIIDWHVVK